MPAAINAADRAYVFLCTSDFSSVLLDCGDSGRFLGSAGYSLYHPSIRLCSWHADRGNAVRHSWDWDRGSLDASLPLDSVPSWGRSAPGPTRRRRRKVGLHARSKYLPAEPREVLWLSSKSRALQPYRPDLPGQCRGGEGEKEVRVRGRSGS